MIGGSSGRLAADQWRQQLVMAGFMRGLCPRGLCNALAAQAKVAAAACSGRLAALGFDYFMLL
jgi:hypothetical protein